MSDDGQCPRKVSREDLIKGLQAGRTACIDRKDAPELQDLLQLENEGLVVSEFIHIDDQSSVLKFRWAQPA